MYDVAIVGGGPAGMAAAIYAGRYQRKTLVIDGMAVGGQLLLTSEIDNYPGFPEGITGRELADHMQRQAERFGAEFMLDTVIEIDFSKRPFLIKTEYGSAEAKTIIIAPGTSRRKLGVPGEREFSGRGVSYCATCDGFFFRDKTVAVVGGGDSAVEEAIVMTRWASKVYLIHRREQLRADRTLQQRALNNPKIEPIWDTVIEEITGEQSVEAVRLHNLKTDARSTLPLEGVFIFVGSVPNTSFLGDAIALDERGYIKADWAGRTNVPGVFAAGEAVAGSWAQVVAATGLGAAAAHSMESFLALEEGRAQPPRER